MNHAARDTEPASGPDAAARLEAVRTRIQRAARIAGRAADDVTLIAISKTHDAEAIEPLLFAGHRIFGENRVQEAQDKWPSLRERYDGVQLHLVGQLQSNKAEDAAALFDCIHSLDRDSLLKALVKAFAKSGRQVPCFVQVDIGDEPQKGGCPIPELPAFLGRVRSADIPLAGLMCVPPQGIEPAPFFALLDKLARDNGLDADDCKGLSMGLSMGMSGDFETAVKLGATHVRVGSALFGDRTPR